LRSITQVDGNKKSFHGHRSDNLIRASQYSNSHQEKIL
jgi:hypothetical protein